MKQTILIIDDSITVRTSLNNFLVPKGYTVYAAENGEEAINMVRRVGPDLIITDIEMPVMSGFDLLTFLRNCNPPIRTPVIMLTGHSDPADVKTAIELGACDYLVKPFNRKILYDMVEKVLKTGAASASNPYYQSSTGSTESLTTVKNSRSAISSLEHLFWIKKFSPDAELRLKKKSGIEFRGLMPIEIVSQLNDVGLNSKLKQIESDYETIKTPVILYVNPFNYPVLKQIDSE